MDAHTDATESEASSSPDAILSPRASGHLESAVYMNRGFSERVVRRIDAITGGTSNEREEDGSFFAPIRQGVLPHRSIPRHANGRDSTCASVNMGDSSEFRSAHAVGDSGGLRSIHETAGTLLELGSRAELGNSRTNSSGFPLQMSTRPSRRYDYMSSPRRPSSPLEVSSASSANLPSLNRAHGTLRHNAMDQMFPAQNVREPRPTQCSVSTPRRSSRRCRLHAQSADDSSTHDQDFPEENIRNIRRRARRTEELPGGFAPRSVLLDSSVDSDPQNDTLNSTPGPSGDNQWASRNYAIPAYSSVLTRQEAFDLIVRNRIENSRTTASLHLQTRFGILQNSQRTPRGLDNNIDGRPKAKEGKDLVVDLECKACMTQLVDTAFLPCGHAVLCRWCANQHMPDHAYHAIDPTLCPMCRKAVTNKVRIFFS